MTQVISGYGAALLCAAIVIVGDALLKLAADNGHSSVSVFVGIGGCLYALSALAWFIAMRHISMAEAGVAYAMFSLLALCAIGALFFGETIGAREVAGICCAVMAIVLMVRFT